MIIAGAKGLAKELLEILAQKNALDNLFFFDNVSEPAADRLFDRFDVLHSFDEVRKIFAQTGDASFALGLGEPIRRYHLSRLFTEAGGTLTSLVSPKADIGQFGNIIRSGCCILPGAVVTSSVSIGRGCLINPNVTISHDSSLGDFVEISPGANVTGNCSIGSFTFIGANAVILPGIALGTNVTVGAGAVVTRDVPDNCVVAGVPAVIRRSVPAIDF